MRFFLTATKTVKVYVALCSVLMFVQLSAGPSVTGASAESAPLLSRNVYLPLISRFGPCVTHNPNQYHALIDTAANCYYNHEHHNDPNTVNDLFGPPGAWFGQTGQSISYPWQTFSAAGKENDLKHNGYKWIVRRGLKCVGLPPSFPGCVTDYRYQVHAVGGAQDIVVRFHSFSVEARFCYQGKCGLVRGGGWQDYGGLFILTPDGKGYCPPLATTPPGYVCGDGPRRDAGQPSFPLYQAGWYGNHAVFPLTIETEPFGDTSPTAPEVQLFRCPAPAYCGYNNSRMRIENAGLGLDSLAAETGQRFAATVTFDGFLNRYGSLANGCTAIGIDCVPTHIDPLPNVGYTTQAVACMAAGEPQCASDDTDTSPAGQSWIQFPN